MYAIKKVVSWVVLCPVVFLLLFIASILLMVIEAVWVCSGWQVKLSIAKSRDEARDRFNKLTEDALHTFFGWFYKGDK